MPASDKIAVFIDGANLYHCAKGLGFEIDFNKLRHELGLLGRLTRIYYYTASLDLHQDDPTRRLTDWRSYHGYHVVTKPAKQVKDPLTGFVKIKGNMDIEIAVDAMQMAAHVTRIILFSGDGDFTALVGALQRRGVRVTIVSSTRTQPSMLADDLRRQADDFNELAHLEELIGRSMQHSVPVRATGRRANIGKRHHWRAALSGVCCGKAGIARYSDLERPFLALPICVI